MKEEQSPMILILTNIIQILILNNIQESSNTLDNADATVLCNFQAF